VLLGVKTNAKPAGNNGARGERGNDGAWLWNKAEEKLRKKKIKRLHQTATALGFELLCAS
jgi:hypothetical protein